MSEAAIAQTIVTVSLLVVLGGLFIWGWRSGQFKNMEDIKYILFRHPPDEEKKGDKGGEKK
jgi:hypothetical protein